MKTSITGCQNALCDTLGGVIASKTAAASGGPVICNTASDTMCSAGQGDGGSRTIVGRTGENEIRWRAVAHTDGYICRNNH